LKGGVCSNKFRRRQSQEEKKETHRPGVRRGLDMVRGEAEEITFIKEKKRTRLARKQMMPNIKRGKRKG